MLKLRRGAKRVCWPCADDDHENCDRKRGRSFYRNWSLTPFNGERVVECDCYPDHRITY